MENQRRKIQKTILMTKRVKNIPAETPAIAAVDVVFGAFKTQLVHPSHDEALG